MKEKTGPQIDISHHLQIYMIAVSCILVKFKATLIELKAKKRMKRKLK